MHLTYTREVNIIFSLINCLLHNQSMTIFKSSDLFKPRVFKCIYNQLKLYPIIDSSLFLSQKSAKNQIKPQILS